MELPIDVIISSIATALCGGGVGGVFTWRYLRRQEKAKAKEAEANALTAETSAVKEVQDVYQQMITDVKTDRDEQKTYIQELKEDRRHLREERDELRNRIDKTDETVRDLQAQVEKTGRMVEMLRPFICGIVGCPDRKPATILEDATGKSKRWTRKKKEEK